MFGFGPGARTLDAVRLAQFGGWRRFIFMNAAGQHTSATVSARDRIVAVDRRLGRWAGVPIGDLLDHARQEAGCGPSRTTTSASAWQASPQPVLSGWRNREQRCAIGVRNAHVRGTFEGHRCRSENPRGQFAWKS